MHQQRGATPCTRTPHTSQAHRPAPPAAAAGPSAPKPPPRAAPAAPAGPPTHPAGTRRVRRLITYLAAAYEGYQLGNWEACKRLLMYTERAALLNAMCSRDTGFGQKAIGAAKRRGRPAPRQRVRADAAGLGSVCVPVPGCKWSVYCGWCMTAVLAGAAGQVLCHLAR
jgi:hypothetical protein